MNPQVNPVTSQVQGTEVWTTAQDGWRLGLLQRDPEGPALGAVVLGHAMMANRRSLDRPGGQGLASALTAAGLITYALDARGHGTSGPHPAEGSNWTYDDVVLRDLPAAIQLVRSRHPDLPMAVLGHSLTGHGVLALLGQRPELGEQLEAIVSVASNVWMPVLEPSRARWIRKWLTLGGFGLATWPVGYFPARRLGMGSEDVSRGFVGMFQELRRTGRWLSADRRIDYHEGLGRARARVLAIAGRGDRLLCHPECSEAFHRRLTGSQVLHWTVGRGVHGLDYDPDHMQLVTDRRSAPLWQAIGVWLRERFERRGEPLVPGFSVG